MKFAMIPLTLLSIILSLPCLAQPGKSTFISWQLEPDIVQKDAAGFQMQFDFDLGAMDPSMKDFLNGGVDLMAKIYCNGKPLQLESILNSKMVRNSFYSNVIAFLVPWDTLPSGNVFIPYAAIKNVQSGDTLTVVPTLVFKSRSGKIKNQKLEKRSIYPSLDEKKWVSVYFKKLILADSMANGKPWDDHWLTTSLPEPTISIAMGGYYLYQKSAQDTLELNLNPGIDTFLIPLTGADAFEIIVSDEDVLKYRHIGNYKIVTDNLVPDQLKEINLYNAEIKVLEFSYMLHSKEPKPLAQGKNLKQ